MALKLKGSTSGFVAIDAPSVAGNNTLILPENNGSAQQLLGNDITAGVTTFTSVTVNRNGDLTVPGTISIGGTLTYEDVTSVDSVGIVTARSGVRINGGGLTIIGDTTGLKTSGISTLGGDVSIADKIIHTGDTNTAIRFPAADTFAVETGGNERIRVDSDGKLGVNNGSSGSIKAQLDVINTTAPTLDNNTHAGEALFLRSGGSDGNGNVQAVISFGKADSGSLRSGSAVASVQTDSDADKIGLGFYTSPSASSSQTLSQKLLITHAGRVGIGTDNPTSHLQVYRETTFAGNPIIQARSNNGSLNELKFQIDGDGKAYFNDQLLVGHTAAHQVAGGNSKIQVQATDSTGRISVVQHRNEAEGAPYLSLGKTRGTSNGAVTVVQSGDTLGTIAFAGGDGTDVQTSAAHIVCQVDGAPGSNDMPGRLLFKTTADGNSSTTTRLTINSSGNANFTGIVTATQFAATTISNGRKNLLMNGEMKVNQRVGSSGLTYFNPVTSSIYTLDRWKVMNGSSFDTDSAHIHQSTQSPTGFSNSMKWEIGNTETPSANQNCGIEQKIEGQNLQHLAYGTSSAKTMTLSFYVRSNKTGTYNVHIMQEDGTKYQMHEYDISSSNTWEKKTIKIVGNTANAINNDNTVGLRIIWVLTVGSSDHVAATSTWASGGDLAGTSNQVNLWDNGSNEWYLTGCQLELGDVATAYEHLGIGEELERCQRYYEKSYNLATRPGDVDNDGSVMFLSNRNNGTAHTMLRFQVRKRANPTVTAYDPTQANTTGMRDLDANQTYNYTMNRMGEMGCTAYPTGSLALGQFIQFHYTAESEL